jgi:tetratricopeptide (TPR) repeat protein
VNPIETFLRSDWDNRLVNLGLDINRLENELVIRDVRNMVNDARATYFAGNFDRAEDLLLRARNRWQVTNASDNEEVVYWLGIVRGALSLRSGRVIPPTAPLYPEMSQLLSDARRNYEEGVRYINMGQRSSGLSKFSEARQQTREVKLIFPVNQEAGILEMRMDQFTDPAAFNASFEQRLRDAVAGTRRRSIESFAELQNLAEINPRYPGIAGILRQAEIDMGYRPPPPNPANIARSRELTASAGRILDGNIQTQFEVALAQINEAIALNPDSTEAMQVKDRLLNRMNMNDPANVVLNSQDEAEFQRAQRELSVGNDLVALSIVNRLLQNPTNRNVYKLIELQRRIQSVLQ